MTTKSELTQRENIKGKGRLLNPKDGQPLSEVDYTVVPYDKVVETSEPTRMEVKGGGQVEVFITHAELPDFRSTWLTLELEDGRRVTGLFTKISDGSLHLVKHGGFDEATTKTEARPSGA